MNRGDSIHLDEKPTGASRSSKLDQYTRGRVCLRSPYWCSGKL
jgi:hypothetical protein